MSPKIDLSRAADQCVMCGMCLPHCPTYQVSQHEAESPRGRISLIKALAEGELNSSPALDEHLQSCTACYRCQQICPAKVDYQRILDQGRKIYRSKQSIFTRLLQTVAISAPTHNWGHAAIKLARHAVKHLPTTNRHLKLLQLVSHQHSATAATQNHATEVNIFSGCTGNLFDQQTLDSLITLLNAIGVKALLPKQILCCGALSQHSGHLHKAESDINKLQQYLSKQQSKILLSIASGCGRQLSEQFANTSIEHFDALDWLSEQTNFRELVFSSSPMRVLMHHPCSLNTAQQHASHELLKRIPNIELIEFNDNLACCGAGGLQLTTPQPSNSHLLDKKIALVRDLQPNAIVSSNIGCSLNFRLGLDNADLDIEVIHPLTLLARQLT